MGVTPILTVPGALRDAPERADARHLLGIIRNLADENEEWKLTEALWDEWVAARDEPADRLDAARDHIETSSATWTLTSTSTRTC